MNKYDFPSLLVETQRIVHDYLSQVTSFANQLYRKMQSDPNPRARYLEAAGFPALHDDNTFGIGRKSENLFEGCTRVFLINPVIDKILEARGVVREWRFGSTYAEHDCSNKDYEDEAYLEFIIEHQQKRIGFRYTPLGNRNQSRELLERDFNYLYNRAQIPAFKLLSPIDEVWSIDWSGLDRDVLDSFQIVLSKSHNKSRAITSKDFFLLFLSDDEFEQLHRTLKSAVIQAQQSIGMKTVPLLFSNNLLSFKDSILQNFTESSVSSWAYEFENSVFPNGIASLDNNDINIINSSFFGNEYRNALKGHSDFAKSFITSEYLFQTTSENLVIDYTSVVVGYLKSVEQLLFIIYESAFQGSEGMDYWDSERNYRAFCSKRKNGHSIPTSGEIENPYFINEKLYKYYHRKKTGSKAPDFGELTYFLRYNSVLWNVSEQGKEYIFACLNDFRSYCRNHHFHKDNIWSTNYDIVRRIRNNTFIILYYLLGSFKLLDQRQSIEAQLGIENYSFNYLYQEIILNHKRLLWAKSQDGYEGLIIYVGSNNFAQYDADSKLTGIELHFVKLHSFTPTNITHAKIKDLLMNHDYSVTNSLIVTDASMLINFTPIGHIQKQ